MGLFGKKKEQPAACGCQGKNAEQAAAGTPKDDAQSAVVKVLGSGCKKCNELQANARLALTQLGMEPAIEHVTDFAQIAAYGVMTTPALIVNNKVVAYGRVLKTDEIVAILQKEVSQ